MEQKQTLNLFLTVLNERVLANSEKYLQIVNEVNDDNIRASNEGKKDNMKPMYLFIKKDIDWTKFKQFDWRKIYYFDTEEEFDKNWDDMTKDMDLWRQIQKQK